MDRFKIKYNIVKALKNKIIISSQASVDEPFYPVECMLAMVKSVLNGGAEGLRLAGFEHISEVRKITKIPIIGITKPGIIPNNYKELVYITPTFNDAKLIKEAGADIIAIDATTRPRPKENLKELISLIHTELNSPVMADVSTYDEGINAYESGADIISTTLSGYTTYSKASLEPDFDLLERLIVSVNVPVILEGRVESIEHVNKAFDLNAYSVVIGSAITRPHLLTKKFVEAKYAR